MKNLRFDKFFHLYYNIECQERGGFVFGNKSPLLINLLSPDKDNMPRWVTGFCFDINGEINE